MIRKFTILLSLCCVVLCTFVGYLSDQAIKSSEKRTAPPVDVACQELIDERPIETSSYLVKDFAPGKFWAEIEATDTGEWSEVCMPLFPRRRSGIKHSYRGVVVCFKGVKNESELVELLQQGELELNFWPTRQDLPSVHYSRLAQRYKSMDFENSVVLHWGFEKEGPLLGKSSLMLSYAVGAIALCVAVFTLLIGFLMKLKPKPSAFSFEEDDEDQPTTNRAGLDMGTSILDQVQSMRERETLAER